MSLIRVDEQKCNRTGACAAVCPVGILEFDPESGPAVIRGGAQFCIACGHCVAVCPHGALDNVRAPLKDQQPLPAFPVVDPETAFLFLRSRRSIRNYRPERVPRERITRLLEAARYAPSGHNFQGLGFIVLEGRKDIEAVSAMVADWMRGEVAAGSELSRRYHFADVVRACEEGHDRILRGAPHLVVATAAVENPAAQITTSLALEYVELYAAALGLGTCWAGYVNMFSLQSPRMAQFLNIPEDRAITGNMMVGIPEFRYHRLPERDPLEVSWFRG
ncbi:MAG: nitroreductase family protein [Thermodesulfobacteriota bacterium]|nr:nitroreductase family protein [Thermodesulfobacteriota bacterium]